MTTLESPGPLFLTGIFCLFMERRFFMSTEIGEPVKVMAVFDTSVKPVKFKWKGKIYPVKEITYTWTSKEGASETVHFSVTDGASLFELAYNPGTMRWTLEGVEC